MDPLTNVLSQMSYSTVSTQPKSQPADMSLFQSVFASILQKNAESEEVSTTLKEKEAMYEMDIFALLAEKKSGSSNIRYSINPNVFEKMASDSGFAEKIYDIVGAFSESSLHSLALSGDITRSLYIDEDGNHVITTSAAKNFSEDDDSLGLLELAFQAQELEHLKAGIPVYTMPEGISSQTMEQLKEYASGQYANTLTPWLMYANNTL